jgi:hypothetical protein
MTLLTSKALKKEVFLILLCLALGSVAVVVVVAVCHAVVDVCHVVVGLALHGRVVATRVTDAKEA